MLVDELEVVVCPEVESVDVELGCVVVVDCAVVTIGVIVVDCVVVVVDDCVVVVEPGIVVVCDIEHVSPSSLILSIVGI